MIDWSKVFDPTGIMIMVAGFLFGIYNARIRDLKKQVAGLQRWRSDDVNPKNLDQYKRIQALEIQTGLAQPVGLGDRPRQDYILCPGCDRALGLEKHSPKCPLVKQCPACQGSGDEGHLDDCPRLP